MVCVAALCGCAEREPAALAHAAATAVAPSGGPAAATAELTADFNSKRITVGGAIDHAVAMLESAATGTPMPGQTSPVASVDATVFAAAVLDFCGAVEPQLPKADEFYLIWMKMGRLAFRAAEEAHAAGRLNESAGLVFRGPKRWQNEGYWYQYPDHDALAAVILARTGNRAEAIHRLQSRIELRGPAQEVYEMLMRGQ
ncbi:MAG: hypothetical protein DYG92_01350 [Leptolyngbya sp. PLA1]|nr:hypothetical protein [Leptolyngbya sp. PLA1]